MALVDTPEISNQDHNLQPTVEQIPDVPVRVVYLLVDVPDQDDLQVGFVSFVKAVNELKEKVLEMDRIAAGSGCVVDAACAARSRQEYDVMKPQLADLMRQLSPFTFKPIEPKCEVMEETQAKRHGRL